MKLFGLAKINTIKFTSRFFKGYMRIDLYMTLKSINSLTNLFRKLFLNLPIPAVVDFLKQMMRVRQ